MSALPSLFVSHGAPTIAVEPSAAAEFLRGLGPRLPAPRAILVISAHWRAARPSLTAAARPDTVHDFGGFPRALYALRYPASGDPALAAAIAARLGDAGLPAALDAHRGHDHGVWTPLMLMYPRAEVPVLQLSLLAGVEADTHYALGQALAPLREQGVLVVGSGGTTHNLRELDFRPGAPAPDWVSAFTDWLAARLADQDLQALLDYRRRAPAAVRNHPSDEHLLPLFVALGAGGWPARRLHTSHSYGALRMDAWGFGPEAAAI